MQLEDVLEEVFKVKEVQLTEVLEDILEKVQVDTVLKEVLEGIIEKNTQ